MVGVGALVVSHCDPRLGSRMSAQGLAAGLDHHARHLQAETCRKGSVVSMASAVLDVMLCVSARYGPTTETSVSVWQARLPWLDLFALSCRTTEVKIDFVEGRPVAIERQAQAEAPES